jgi:hypothetical protein
MKTGPGDDFARRPPGGWGPWLAAGRGAAVEAKRTAELKSGTGPLGADAQLLAIGKLSTVRAGD